MPVSKPNTTVQKLSVPSPQANVAQKALIIGGMLSDGTATAGAIQRSISSGAIARGLFGQRSMAADMATEFLKINTESQLDAIGIADITAVAAHGHVIFSGTATNESSGTLTVVIGGRSYGITVTKDMTASQIGAALVVLIEADGSAVVSSSNSSGNVTLTCLTAGAAGNSTTLTASTSDVTGVTFPLTSFSGGVTASVKAAGTVVFSGTATAAGTLSVAVGSKVNRLYPVSVTVGMTAAECATALAALITADATAPFTASAGSETVTITMANGGTEGNATCIEVISDGVVDGLAWTLSAFTGGAGLPTMTSVLDVVGDTRYQTIIAPYGFGTSYLSTFLDARWNVNNAIKDGVAVLCAHDSYADMITLGGTLNSKSLCVFGDLDAVTANHVGPSCAEFDCNKAAQFGAIRALRLTSGADISQFVTSSVGRLDNTGGAAIASLPYFNTPMVNLPLLSQEVPGFTAAQIDALRDVGISAIGNNVADTAVICSEIVSTYKTDSSGSVDTTWKFLETVDTASAAIEYIFNNLKADFSQCRLTTGDLIPGRAMANEESIAASFAGYYNALAGADYVLVQAGEAALNLFKENLDITITMSTGSVTATGILPIVTQLRTILVPFSIVLRSV